MRRISYVFVQTLIACLMSDLAAAGTWTRPSQTTLRFDGYIEKGDKDVFLQNYTAETTTLEVNSRGGDAQEGILLGIALKPKRLDIVVDGVCASSCANYIFCAAKTKTIKHGFVGFHGNITALNKLGIDGVFRNLLAMGKTPNEISDLWAQSITGIANEQQFFGDLGISQELFDRTQVGNKGITGDQEYLFLLPSPRTFKKYGINEVTGDQDLGVARSFGIEVAYY